MNKFKCKNIRLSGEKLRVSYKDICLSFDLSAFSMFKVEKDKKTIAFLEGEMVLDGISFDTQLEADKFYEIISKKVFKKNKRFRNIIFVTKVFVWIALAYVLVNFLAFRAEQQALMQSYQKQLSAYNTKTDNIASNNVKADVKQATGDAVSVEDVFKLNK